MILFPEGVSKSLAGPPLVSEEPLANVGAPYCRTGALIYGTRCPHVTKSGATSGSVDTISAAGAQPHQPVSAKRASFNVTTVRGGGGRLWMQRYTVLCEHLLCKACNKGRRRAHSSHGYHSLDELERRKAANNQAG